MKYLFYFSVCLFLCTGCATLNHTYMNNYKNINEFCDNIEKSVQKKSSIARSHCLVEATKTERIIDQENTQSLIGAIRLGVATLLLLIFISN